MRQLSKSPPGSDLAGIQSRAKQQEDGSWRLSGQRKGAGRRTPSTRPTGCCSRAPTPTLPKHKGLTMFIVPMDAEG